ncbi:MAG: ABC transporter ATP-binding protein [Cytophagales bacterium]|nr:ABC transporter ATP-binding protein [Bernardetiaceae bacterium]MDW8210756.1 ABC transporter ATP-binding protein [Cytophagales bacterium]
MATEKEQPPILSVQDLKVCFDTKHGKINAIENISFQVKKRETIGIVGESGSGKSITALSIMRLIPQPGNIEEGKILFFSPSLGQIDITRLSHEEMRMLRGGEITMIFQDPMTSLNPVFTCGSQVVEAIELHQPRLSHREAKQLALEMFEKVKLPHPERIFKAYPHELSGGQKQRVMIAMALSCNPTLLIADEPTTALDVTVQSRILELFQELREQIDTAILFISHDLGVIAEVADRLLVMYNGRIVEQGSTWNIFSSPQHPYTKGLLACRPRLDIKLKVLPVIADFMDTDAQGNVIDRQENKFKSVGQALLQNVQTKEEIQERRKALLSQEPLLKVNKLRVHFPIERNLLGKVTRLQKAVDEVSFEVYPGETLGLVGASGCGKTTLGRAILNLIDPAYVSGEVYYRNANILQLPKKQLRQLRREIQIIFQDPYSSLNPRMTIGEAIIEPMRFHNLYENDRKRKEVAIDLLETVNLSSVHFYRFPHEFSGGQRQRICIARTLALQPKFIICDESVSALDVSVQAQVLNLLNQLKEKFGLTYIFISHDLSVVKFISDRIMVMKEGKIVECGFAEDIYEHPQHEYTRRLIRSIPKGTLEDVRRAMLRRKMSQRN